MGQTYFVIGIIMGGLAFLIFIAGALLTISDLQKRHLSEDSNGQAP